MASNASTRVPLAEKNGAGSGCVVQQRKENAIVPLKKENSFGKFSSSYLWKIEEFSQYFSDPTNFKGPAAVTLPKIMFGSCEWELYLNVKKHPTRSDIIAIISFSKGPCNVSEMTVQLRMSFVDKKGCKQFLKEYEIQNYQEIYRGVFYIGKNMLDKKLLEDFLQGDCLTICCELIAQDMFPCQSTWKRYLGSDWLDSSPCLTYLSGDFFSMLNDKNTSDVVLTIDKHKFYAHKVILSARSEVFSAMFEHNMKEKREGYVEIKDAEVPDFEDFLVYLYSGTIPNVSVDRLLKLYVLADRYAVQALKDRCCELIASRLNEDNLWGLLRLIEIHNDEKLKSCVKSFLMFNDYIFYGEKWKEFSKEKTALASEIRNKVLVKELGPR